MKRQLFTLMVITALLLPAGAVAQSGLARIVGTVRDQTGAFVPGATVVVRNEKTGEERAATTDTQGLIAVTNLKPSTYTIKATCGDFTPTEYTGNLGPHTLEFGGEYRMIRMRPIDSAARRIRGRI